MDTRKRQQCDRASGGGEVTIITGVLLFSFLIGTGIISLPGVTWSDSLKILLSAFACEPNAGSEPAVGWNWALFLARAGHQVVVLTRARARSAVERIGKGSPPDPHLCFEYFDVP
jgi:hypothetical protein